MAASTATPTLQAGTGRAIAKLIARYVAPGALLTIAAQNLVVLPTVLGPVAAVLGFDVR